MPTTRGRKRSLPATPAASPEKSPANKCARGRGGAAAADPPTLVTAAPPPQGWSYSLRSAREAGKLVDITLIAGGCKIPAHKVVLASHSPYLNGLLTSGLAESKQGGDELKIGDADTDGRAVEALVDCMYSGQLSVSLGSVSSVICTANLFGVDAAEKAACDFFVDALEPSTACEALAFAASRAAGGEQAVALRERCVEYVVGCFADESASRGLVCLEPSFLDLPCEVVVEVIGSDDLPVEEETVLSVVRAWFDHNAVDRHESLKVLLPLVRWPLLPVEVQLKLPQEPLLIRMMRLDDEARTLSMQLLLECSSEFGNSDAAAACPRLKRRKTTKRPPLAFTALSEAHYGTGEDGALLKTTAADALFRAALCREAVMSSGQSCAEFTAVHFSGRRGGGGLMIGVGRPTLGTNTVNADCTSNFWGWSTSGALFHSAGIHAWRGERGYHEGDVLRLLLDSDAGTLTVKKNGTLLGVAVSSGLTGDLCWAVSCGGDYHRGDSVPISVRIKALEPAEF